MATVDISHEQNSQILDPCILEDYRSQLLDSIKDLDLDKIRVIINSIPPELLCKLQHDKVYINTLVDQLKRLGSCHRFYEFLGWFKYFQVDLDYTIDKIYIFAFNYFTVCENPLEEVKVFCDIMDCFSLWSQVTIRSPSVTIYTCAGTLFGYNYPKPKSWWNKVVGDYKLVEQIRKSSDYIYIIDDPPNT